MFISKKSSIVAVVSIIRFSVKNIPDVFSAEKDIESIDFTLNLDDPSNTTRTSVSIAIVSINSFDIVIMLFCFISIASIIPVIINNNMLDIFSLFDMFVIISPKIISITTAVSIISVVFSVPNILLCLF